jgi:hypothetical protein
VILISVILLRLKIQSSHHVPLAATPARGRAAAPHFDVLNEAIAGWSHGRAVIPVEWLRSPEEHYRARMTLADDVNELADSFSSFSSIHDTSMVVIFWPDGEPLPNKASFSIQMYVDDLKASPDDLKEMDGCFAIIGDHTQLAIKQLHDEFPRNPKWAHLTCEVLICHRSFENYRHLKSWGIIDNVKGQKRTTVSFQSKMLSLHEDISNLKAQLGDVDAKTFNKAQLSLKEARKAEYAMKTNSFNQLWTLAARSGDVWMELRKIFTGNVANREKFKIPKSASNFTSMGAIPDEDLLVLLRAVSAGRMSLKQFTDNCRAYKATARVQRDILSHEDIQHVSWVEAQQSFPSACSDGFVGIWAQYILARNLPQKTPLPPEFHAMLGEKLVADGYVQQQLQTVSSVSVAQCGCWMY